MSGSPAVRPFAALLLAGPLLAGPLLAAAASPPPRPVHLAAAPVANITPTPRRLPVLDGRVMFGLSTTLAGDDFSRPAHVEARTKARVKVVNWFQSFPTPLLKHRAKAIRASGRIPMVTWQPAPSIRVNQPAYRLSAIAAGRYDTYLRRWGRQLAAVRGPVWLRFAPEMNGNWTPWSEGVNRNAAGSYVRAWRHVHHVVTAAGARNVLWMWCPNIPYARSTPLAGLYPGDRYVDLLGLDGYNFGATRASGWRSPARTFDAGLAQERAITHRPVVLGEVGSTETGGDKAVWVREFMRYLDRHPQVVAFVWFDLVKGPNWRIDSSAGSEVAFRKGFTSMLRRPIKPRRH